MLGGEHVKSTWFQIAEDDDAIALQGRGHGHGVGLCQAGAIAKGRAGETFSDILCYYYTDMDLKRVY